MKTVRLITCNNAMQAHILQGALENEGIESILHNGNFSSLYSGCINNISGVDIFVSEKDHAKAVEILKDNGSWPEDLILCPYCHSTSIQLVLKKGYKLRALGAAFLSALSTTPPGNNHWEYLCKRCQNRFDIPISTQTIVKKENNIHQH